MHILLIHQSFASFNEPGGTRHYELALYLAKSGYRVTIIASPVSYLSGQVSKKGEPLGESLLDGQEPEGNGGVTILRAYTYSALHKSFIHRVVSFFSFMVSAFLMGLKVKDVDVVWGTSPPIFQGVTAWLLARVKQVPFLFEIRDLWPAFAVQVGVLRQPTLIRASEWLERFLYRHSDRVIVNSPGFVDHVRERGARQVFVVSNGVDPRMFDPQADGSSFCREHGLEGKYIVLYAGAHGVSNDLLVVVEAADLMRDNQQIEIVFLGDGKEKPALMEKAKSMGLSNIHFLPPIPKAEMPQALAAADACLAILKPIPLYATVYPNKVFDYMAAGKPVLLAIRGVIKEVVEDAGAGICVSPGAPAALADAIRFLASRPQEGREMGMRGRHYVEAHFDRAVLAEQLSKHFRELKV